MVPTVKKREYDVLINGAGPIGTLSALSLAKLGLDVGLIDRQPLDILMQPPSDGRAFSIAYGSKLILDRLGLWETLEEVAEPIKSIAITQEGGHTQLQYGSFELKEAVPLGYIIKNHYLKGVLCRALKEYPNISLISQRQLKGLSHKEGKIEVSLDQGEELSSSLLIAADGKFSDVRRLSNIKVTSIDYKSKGLLFNVQHPQPHQGRAHEHFLTTGPFALLPMRGLQSSIVWSGNSCQIDQMVKLDPASFNILLRQQYTDFRGPLSLVGQRWSFPLSALIVEEMIGERVLLVGDAAHAIHPVAGQGLNLGFRDVEVLADVMERMVNIGLDIGTSYPLKEYAKRRRADVFQLTLVTDGLVRLFGFDSSAVRYVRDLGLSLVHHLKPVKAHFMRQAMGI